MNTFCLYAPFPVAVNKSSVVLTIPFSGSIFTRISTVERLLSMRVSATIKRSLSNCFARMIYTPCKKQCILHFYSKGYKAPTIQNFLAAGNLVCSCDGIAELLKVFECTGSICRQPGSSRQSNLTHEVKDFFEQLMVRGASIEDKYTSATNFC